MYGWLRLDRRGRWRLRESAGGAFGEIGNAALRDFIGRNYAADAQGRWYFQNGPQRVYVSLDYAPLVARSEGGGFADHRGRPLPAHEWLLDDEGSLLLAGAFGVALLDDRDLPAVAEGLGDALERLPSIARAELPVRFGFVRDPAP